VARCVRSTSATHHVYFEHSRLVGSRFVTAPFRTGHSSTAQLRFWRFQIPTQRAQGTMAFHDATTASVDHSALDRRAFSALRIPNDRTSDIPVAAHPAPLVIGFRPFPTRWPQTRLRAPAYVSRQDRFHPALREENDAFPARNAFPRQAPFEDSPPCRSGPYGPSSVTLTSAVQRFLPPRTDPRRSFTRTLLWRRLSTSQVSPS